MLLHISTIIKIKYNPEITKKGDAIVMFGPAKLEVMINVIKKDITICGIAIIKIRTPVEAFRRIVINNQV